METTEFVNSTAPVNNELAYLLSLAQNPSKHGELIENFDTTVDKIDNYILDVQNKIADQLNQKIKAFELAIAQDDPPDFLSDQDIDSWHKIAALEDNEAKLMTFKKTLVANFKHELYRQLGVEQLTEQNITIRLILDKLRQIIMI